MPTGVYERTPAACAAMSHKHTAEARAKISAAQKGRTLTPEHKANLSKAMKGKGLGTLNRTVPIGSTRINSGGYLLVKVAQPSVWELESRVVAGLNTGDGLIAHHINEDKTDNRRENIDVQTRPKHCKQHNPRLGTGA